MTQHARKYGPFQPGDRVCERGSRQGYAWDVVAVEGDKVTVMTKGLFGYYTCLASELEICEREEWC